MKKAFSVFAALLLIIAAGCENQRLNETKTPIPLPESFSSNIKVVYGEAAMTAALKQISANEFEVKILSPEILTPLMLYYKDGTCTVTYDGLKFETDLNRFPQVSFGSLMINTLSDIKQGIDIQTTYSEGIWTYKGTGERGVFTLTRDGKTGALLELSIEGAPLHVVFSDFK